MLKNIKLPCWNITEEVIEIQGPDSIQRLSSACIQIPIIMIILNQAPEYFIASSYKYIFNIVNQTIYSIKYTYGFVMLSFAVAILSVSGGGLYWPYAHIPQSTTVGIILMYGWKRIS